MIAGEYVDTEYEGKQITEEYLEYIHQNKTGALLKLSVRMGAILSNCSEEELEGFNIIRSILSEVVSADEISYKDVERYFSILYKNNTRKWICRLYFNSSKKSITISDENKEEVRYYIENVSDIYKYKNELIDAIEKYLVKADS